MTDVWVAVGGVLFVALVILVAYCVERRACGRRRSGGMRLVKLDSSEPFEKDK